MLMVRQSTFRPVGPRTLDCSAHDSCLEIGYELVPDAIRYLDHLQKAAGGWFLLERRS